MDDSFAADRDLRRGVCPYGSRLELLVRTQGLDGSLCEGQHLFSRGMQRPQTKPCHTCRKALKSSRIIGRSNSARRSNKLGLPWRRSVSSLSASSSAFEMVPFVRRLVLTTTFALQDRKTAPRQSRLDVRGYGQIAARHDCELCPIPLLSRTEEAAQRRSCRYSSTLANSVDLFGC